MSTFEISLCVWRRGPRVLLQVWVCPHLQRRQSFIKQLWTFTCFEPSLGDMLQHARTCRCLHTYIIFIHIFQFVNHALSGSAVCPGTSHCAGCQPVSRCAGTSCRLYALVGSTVVRIQRLATSSLQPPPLHVGWIPWFVDSKLFRWLWCQPVFVECQPLKYHYVCEGRADVCIHTIYLYIYFNLWIMHCQARPSAQALPAASQSAAAKAHRIVWLLMSGINRCIQRMATLYI